MNKKELERTWKKILKRSCLGDFNCMISPENPYYFTPECGMNCPLLLSCEHEATTRIRKTMKEMKEVRENG